MQNFIKLAKQLKKPVLVDPKGSDFSIYQHATLITPNLSEFEAVVGRCADQQQIVERGLNLIDEHDLQALLVTRGEHGMTLLSQDQAPLHLPTHAREVFDVTGAGDTVISVLAASLAAKKSLAEATQLANIGAGIVVGKLGTATVNTEELNTALHGSRADHQGVCRLDTLLAQRQAAKLAGEKIVATNGCFDILHPGHVRYLQQAKTLGDRLVVLVNSDASVRELKGPGRPLNSEFDRAEVLSGLRAVDGVVVFDSLRATELIRELKPHLYAKGGDYTPASLGRAARAGRAAACLRRPSSRTVPRRVTRRSPFRVERRPTWARSRTPCSAARGR